MAEHELVGDLLELLTDYKDFNATAVTRSGIPSAVEFAQHVSKGVPRIYRAFTKDKSASGEVKLRTDPNLVTSPSYLWSSAADLTDLVDVEVEIAVTPTGRADDLHTIEGQDEAVFLAPATTDMTLKQLLHTLNEDSKTPVHYLQSQNSNLTSTPLEPILRHVPENFPFAEPVLGQPEAINLWIGDERSVTSTHRDPYENLYLVLKGKKVFTLYPAIDEVALPSESVRTGKYEYDPATRGFQVVLDGDQARIPWIVASPLESRESLIEKYPLYKHASPRQIEVHEGEILYLPSGWYHHVQQECGTWDRDETKAPCIAVNYWYDMDYDGEKYVMRQLLGRLAARVRGGTK